MLPVYDRVCACVVLHDEIMENDVKQRTQRNRRRERAQRMLAQKRENKVKNGADSGEDESPTREKPQRPPPPSRRKKTKDPAGDEDVIDGFAILSFKSYDDLEVSGSLN